MSPAQICGFIAAEGHFSQSGTKFKLVIGLAAEDEKSVDAIARSLAVGTRHRYPARRFGTQEQVTWQVQALPELVQVIVPLCDAYLLPCHKRDQYTVWRSALFAHLESRHRTWFHGPRICSVESCDELVRAKGLCRRHYHIATGR